MATALQPAASERGASPAQILVALLVLGTVALVATIALGRVL